jgi:hypothetical protein
MDLLEGVRFSFDIDQIPLFQETKLTAHLGRLGSNLNFGRSLYRSITVRSPETGSSLFPKGLERMSEDMRSKARTPRRSWRSFAVYPGAETGPHPLPAPGF